MSVLVKGMKMPDCCNKCEFHWEEDVSFEIIHQCQVKTGYIDNADIHSFPYDCPLVELPEKHGRLIDAEALIDTLEQAIAIMETILKQLDLEADDGCLMEIKAYRDIRDGIKEIDAVIEAEGVEE